MKVFLSLVLLAAVAVLGVFAEEPTCGGACSGSTSCVTSSGDLHCRCTNFVCGSIGDTNCGGGCLTDAQCAEWAQGDETCKCTNLICRREGDTNVPKYTRSNHFAALIKDITFRQRFIEANDYSKVKHLE